MLSHRPQILQVSEAGQASEPQRCACLSLLRAGIPKASNNTSHFSCVFLGSNSGPLAYRESAFLTAVSQTQLCYLSLAFFFPVLGIEPRSL